MNVLTCGVHKTVMWTNFNSRVKPGCRLVPFQEYLAMLLLMHGSESRRALL